MWGLLAYKGKEMREEIVSLEVAKLANNALNIFKTRGLSVGGCKKASGRAFFTKRLMTPEMVETYKNVSTVESPLLVNNWRPRPPFFYFPLQINVLEDKFKITRP